MAAASFGTAITNRMKSIGERSGDFLFFFSLV
jgi:hypothetical protein